MNNSYTENDWKLFRNKIADWQETYIEKLNQEYIALLTGDKSAAEKFWELEERINHDKNNSGVHLQMRRSQLVANIISLLNEEVITVDDLADFSDELKSVVSIYTERIIP